MSRHVIRTMGTVSSLELVTEDQLAAASVARVLNSADARFSLHRPDSELSAVARGLPLVEASAEVLAAYALALDWRRRTEGQFTAHRPDGVLDLSGIVKSWAMAAAGDALRDRGAWNWCLNVGGDVLTEGVDHEGRPWIVGIADPADRARLLTAVSLDDDRRAIATSGSTERGDHIWGARALDENGFRQVTVIAPDIVTADVLATALVAGGRDYLDEATSRFPIEVLTVDRAGELLITPGMREAMHAAA